MNLVKHLNELAPTDSYDVAIVGAGGAGLAAALFAALDGARVLVLEHTEFIGGTTALSAGTAWIPGTLHNQRTHPQDSVARAAQYLDHAVGAGSDAALRQVFLDQGCAIVNTLETKTDVHFRPYAKHPDYLSELPGSTLHGRALEPLPFDGRLLGELFTLLRPPIPEFTVLGGMMVDRTDINHLLALSRTWASFKHSARILVRHALDRMRYPRGTRLVMGNALVARLLYSLSKQKQVTLLMQTQMEDMSCTATQATLVLRQGSIQRKVSIRGGIILASGGFNRGAKQRQQMLPNIDATWCPAAPGHTGQAQQLARAQGAQFAQKSTPAFWAPVSLHQRPDGTHATFPHFVMDRAKPGMMTVNPQGQRFVNESTSYHLFALAMQETGSIPAYLVCDAVALQRYGLGMIRPGTKPHSAKLQAWIDNGYLTTGLTLTELAHKLGIDAQALTRSAQQMNHYAKTGLDPEFGRGQTAYQQNIGDASRQLPNPNLGLIQTAPFYALRLYPGDIGACAGLICNEHAQVLNQQGTPIPKLYAVGNDMNSIMGAVYPAPGITIGPGLVFGAIAARHAGEAARATHDR